MYTKIDNETAYNKGKPIRNVDQIAGKLSTIPMNQEWIDGIKDMHWYHENRDIREYTLRDPQNGHRMLELRDKLLTFGGQETCVPCYDEDLVKILDRGQLWLGDRITMMKGLPSQCHLNSTRLWYANKDKVALCTGYALSEDGVWRQRASRS